MNAHRERGFTLSELMITIALVGVLATLGVTLLRTSPQPVDVASQISSKLAETSRKAVAYGAVRGDVAAALGSRARTRAVIASSPGGVTLTVARLEEDPFPAASASWIELSTVTLPPSVALAGYTPAAVLAGGGMPTIAVGTTGAFEVRCQPEGTCDGVTIYLDDAKGTRHARVVVLPLGGTPMTFDTW